MTLPQILILAAVLAFMFFLLDYNRQVEAGELVGVDRDGLQQEVDAEVTRTVELQATLEYVQSEDYVAAYARNEAGFMRPGEVRIVPMLEEATPSPPPPPPPTPDPARNARPWQAWWQLMTDAPLPGN